MAYPKTPAAAWEPHKRWLTHDGHIELPIGCFLVETGSQRVLIDAGLGHLEFPGLSGPRLPEELKTAGFTPEPVTDVALTHLHGDHTGCALAGAFPNAAIRCDAADLAHFTEITIDRVEPWSGQRTLAPGIDTMPTPGHTPGHTAFVISSGDQRVLLLGDAV